MHILVYIYHLVLRIVAVNCTKLYLIMFIVGHTFFSGGPFGEEEKGDLHPPALQGPGVFAVGVNPASLSALIICMQCRVYIVAVDSYQSQGESCLSFDGSLGGEGGKR